MQRSDPFALLLPRSIAAKESLLLRTNRSCVQLAGRRTQRSKDIQIRRRVAQLSFAFMTGRRYIAFGSTRRAEFQLAPIAGVEECHFVLHFDLETTALLLTDTSRTGMWIGSRDAPRRIHHTTQRIGDEVLYIGLGRNREIEFDLLFPRRQRDYAVLFEQYRRSLQWPERIVELAPNRDGCVGKEPKALEGSLLDAATTRTAQDAPSKRRRSSQLLLY